MQKEDAEKLHWKIVASKVQTLQELYALLINELPRGYWGEIIPTMHMGAITGHKVVVKWWNNPGTFAHKIQITPKGDTYNVLQPSRKFFRVDRWAKNNTGISHEYMDNDRDFLRLHSNIKPSNAVECEGLEHITITGFVAQTCNDMGWDNAVQNNLVTEPKYYR